MVDPIIVRKQSGQCVATELVDIKVIPTELHVLGQRSIVKVIRSGDAEGLTVANIAEMTNINERSVWKHIYNHAITTVPLGPQSLRSLKDAGVLLLHSRRAVFVPKAGVIQLLKFINTPESWAIYYQLWNNSERLEELEAKLLETAGKLKSALDQSAIRLAMIRSRDQQIADLSEQLIELQAKLEAASHHIALGGNRKSPRFSIPVYRREPNDIFNNPVYSIEVLRKSREEMDEQEQARFSSYHAVRIMSGLSRGVEKNFDKIGVTNESARSSLSRLVHAVTVLKDEIEPNTLGLLALNQGNGPEYMNQPAGA